MLSNHINHVSERHIPQGDLAHADLLRKRATAAADLQTELTDLQTASAALHQQLSEKDVKIMERSATVCPELA